MNIALNLLKRARMSPDLPAVTFGDSQLSFGALVERASRVAGAIEGLAPGSRVVLFMENRAEFIELLFAGWIAGLCMVPVNAKLHAREVAHIIEDCDARLIFTTKNSIDQLEPLFNRRRRYLIAVDGAEFEDYQLSNPLPCAEVSPDDLAWIFYTSGTTGVPKGAMLSHGNLLVMALTYYADVDRITPDQTMFHAAPLSHGSGLYALPHLFGGGHQLVMPGFDAAEVLAAFGKYPAVSMFAAPTMVTRMLQAAKGMADPVGNLRTILYGGAPMYLEDILRALDVFGPRFFQLYGQGESPMTITGMGKAEHEGDRGPEHLRRLASCGVARTGVEVRVVDSAGRTLPVGQIGEVVTRSQCVMAGYWNNIEGTATALRDGWLWTGDIGSLDELGYLTLRDRSKDMIISGGTNIYPREVEEVLLSHPAVLECSVVGRRHSDWGEEAVAFVVPRDDETVTAEMLDTLCLGQIARFKRPKDYRFVEALPKSNNGKILKAELRRMLEAEIEDA